MYPNVKITIQNDLTDNLFRDLRNGNLDIVITSIPNDTKGFKLEKICDLHDIFVSSKKENFNFKNLILQKRPSINRTNFDEYAKSNNISYEVKMEVVSHNLLVKFVEHGFGIGLVTKEFVKDKLGNNLYELNTEYNIPSRCLGFAIKDDVYPTFTTKKFIEILKKDDL